MTKSNAMSKSATSLQAKPQSNRHGISAVPDGNVKKVLRGSRSPDKPIKVLEEQSAEDEEDKVEHLH